MVFSSPIFTAARNPPLQARNFRNPLLHAMLRATTSLPKQPFAFFIFHSDFLLSVQQEPAAWSLQFNLQCTDDDNRSYRNVCNMPFVSFSLAVIFVISLFSTSAFRVLNIDFVSNWMISNCMLFGFFIIFCSLSKNGLLNAKIQFSSLAKSPKSCKNFKWALQ